MFVFKQTKPSEVRMPQVNLNGTVFHGDESLINLRATRLRKAKEEAVQRKINEIRAQGQISPMLILDNADGTFDMLDGEHRLVAIRALKGTGEHSGDIAAIVVGMSADFSDNDLLEFQIGANFHEETSPVDTIDAITRLAQNGVSVKDIAKKLGMGETKLRDLLKTTKLPEFIREDLAAGKISMVNALALKGVEITAEDELYAAAKSCTNSELTPLVAAAKKPSAKTVAPTEFTPKRKNPTGKEVTEAYEQAIAAAASGTKSDLAVKAVFDKLFGMDDAGIAEQKKAWDERAEKAKAKELETKAKLEKQKAEIDAKLAGMTA